MYTYWEWTLRWRVSKLIFACAQNDHFQYGELQSLTGANGHLDVLVLGERSVPTTFCLLAGFARGSKALNPVERARHSAA